MLNIKLHKFHLFILYSIFSLLIPRYHTSYAERWDDVKIANKAKFSSPSFDRCGARINWICVYFFAVSITQFFSYWTYGLCSESYARVCELTMGLLSGKFTSIHYQLPIPFTLLCFMSWMWVWITCFLNVYHLSRMWKKCLYTSFIGGLGNLQLDIQF